MLPHLTRKPWRRPVRERMNWLDLTYRLGRRLIRRDGPAVDVQDAVLRQDMEWLTEAPASIGGGVPTSTPAHPLLWS